MPRLRAVDCSAALAYQGGALIEEYLTGPEISIDGAVVDGRYTPLFVARKTVGMHPYFEELGHLVNAADGLMSDPQLLATLASAHRAIEFRHGVTHTEVKLTGRGPVIVEINGRLGGDMIPLLAPVRDRDRAGRRSRRRGAGQASGDPARRGAGPLCRRAVRLSAAGLRRGVRIRA